MIMEPTAQDIIVEDNDPFIQYAPPAIWIQSTDQSIIEFGTTYTVTHPPGALGAWAAFSFEGTRIWYYADRLYTHGMFGASIDGGPMAVYSSYNTALAKGQLLYYADLPPGKHTLNITSLEDTKVIGVDRFIYRPIGIDPVSTSTEPTPSSDPRPSPDDNADAPPTPHSVLSAGAYIGIGFAAGAGVILLLLVIALLWTRPPRHRVRRAWSGLEPAPTRQLSLTIAHEPRASGTELPAYEQPPLSDYRTY